MYLYDALAQNNQAAPKTKPVNAVRAPDPNAPPPAPTQAVPTLAAPKPQLPVQGVKYAGTPAFTFPSGYGHAAVTGQDGTTAFSYSSPEDVAASAGRAKAYTNQRLDDQRHSQLSDLHGAIMAHLRGENGQYGNVDPESRAYNLSGLVNLHNNLLSADTAQHQLAQQLAVDPHRNPEYVAALTNQTNAQADYARAHATEATAKADAVAHPERKLDLLDKLANDPVKRALFLSSQGVTPEVQATLPLPAPQAPPGGGPAIHLGNVNEQLQRNSDLSGLASIFGNKDSALHEKLAAAAQIPGFRDPNSPNRQAFNAKIHELYPNKEQWNAELNAYPKYGPQDLGGLSGVPGVQTVGGTALGLIAALSDPNALGGGYSWGNWGKNYAAGQELQRLLRENQITY
jgi:hypothetical protein